MKYKIVVLSGGTSEEKDVSKISANEISNALNSIGFDAVKVDPGDFYTPEYSVSPNLSLIREIKTHNPLLVFNGLHGGCGENGMLQALLEMEKIPFTGSGYKSCAVAMDKELSNLIAEKANLKIPETIILNSTDCNLKQITDKLGLPFVVKPVSSGSSFGISIVKEEKDIPEALNYAFEYDNRVMLQEFIEGKEITVTILDDIPLPVVEIRPFDGWYDYKNKYTKGKTEYIVPAEINDRESHIVQEQALRIFKLMQCSGYARVDFRYDGINFYFLEVNTLPGMTPLSLTPMAAQNVGLTFPDLLLNIIDSTLRKEIKEKFKSNLRRIL